MKEFYIYILEELEKYPKDTVITIGGMIDIIKKAGAEAGKQELELDKLRDSDMDQLEHI